MVKSPWRLLTGLLSRRTRADRHQAEGRGAGSSSPETSAESEPVPAPEVSAAFKAGEDEVGDHQEPPSSMAAEVPDAMLAAEATASAPDRNGVAIGAKRRTHQGKAPSKTRRKIKAIVPIHARDAEPAIALAEQVAANEPDPVRKLDSEIRDLRSQLAGKLRLQNDQLRQMLRRFEPE